MSCMCALYTLQAGMVSPSFITTPDSFATPIGGYCVTWGCLNWLIVTSWSCLQPAGFRVSVFYQKGIYE